MDPPLSVHHKGTRSTITWEDVDLALEHYHRHDIDSLKILTAERRYFGMLAAYDFMYTTLTRDPNGGYGTGYGWKPSRVRRVMAGLETLLLEAKCRVFALEKERSLKECIDPSTGQCRFIMGIDTNILESRHTEINDPDKIIWQKLYEENLVDEKIVKAYAPVEKLVPEEPVGLARNWRTGLVSPPTVSNGELKLNRTKEADESVTPAEVYGRFIRSDEHSLPTNDLSRMYKVPHQIISGIHCNVSRRLDAYLEAEKNKSAAGGTRYPSNLVRGLALAYLISSPFGAGYSGMQAFQRGFALSATTGLLTASTYFSSSYTHVRKAVQRHLMTSATEKISGRVRYPARSLVPLTLRRGEPMATLARTVSTFQPTRIEREAIARFTSPIAEASSRGPIAVWLSSTMSSLLGRRVTPQYAQLLLTNWAARHPTRDDLLRRVAVLFGVVFDSNTGLAVPSVGFGSGLTRRKLAAYAARNLKNGIGTVITRGRTNANSNNTNTSDRVSLSMSLEAISASFFKNTSVVRLGGESSSDSANNECGCACHNVAGLRGTEFIPCPARRLIKERVYTASLKKSPQLSFTFGMCGYQHPLSANSDPQIQRIKERLLFDQRNVAAALNHSRLVQFLLPETVQPDSLATKEVTSARERLLGMPMASIARLSRGLKVSAATARVTTDICVKFNARMWPLSLPTDSFLKRRIGVYVDRHARQHYSTVLQLHGRFEEASAILDQPAFEVDGNDPGSLPKWVRDIAQKCVLGQSNVALKVWHDKPAVEMAENRDWPAPFLGVYDDELVYPSSAGDHIDRTANMCGDVESSFWVTKTPGVFLDACTARSVISERDLHHQYYRRLLVNNQDTMQQLEQSRAYNEQVIAMERPRKVDTKPWSIKNTGQSGRRTTEMTPNSLMVITGDHPTEYDGPAAIFLAMVETQAIAAKADLQYPSQRESINCKRETGGSGGSTDRRTFVAAPDIAPVYRTGGNSMSPISLKHFRRSGIVSYQQQLEK